MDYVITLGHLAFWALLVIGVGALAVAAMMLFASGMSTNPEATRKAQRSSRRVAIAGVVLCAAAFLTGCTDPPDATKPASAELLWDIGPPWDGRTGSRGMPRHPSLHPDGLAIDLPAREIGNANYVTRPTGPLSGNRRIRLRYRVEAEPGAFIGAAKPLGERWEGKLTLYFEHRGNDFTGGPVQNWRRWWAPATTTRLAPGEYELVARFDQLWTAVSYGANECTADGNDPDCLGPARFQEALANAGRVGFTLGGGDGLGHGAYGPARIVILEFAVE